MVFVEVEMLGRGSVLVQLIVLLCDIVFMFCFMVVCLFFFVFWIFLQGMMELWGSEGGFKGVGGVEFYEGKVWYEC